MEEMNISTLTRMSLKSVSITQLYQLSQSQYLPVVELEIERRLLSSNKDLYIPVIDLIYDKMDDPVIKRWLDIPPLRQSLKESIPWKIGVIYDYRDESHNIKHLAIMVGKPTAYRVNGQYFKPTWMTAERNKLTIREVINRTGRPINNAVTVVTADRELDQTIRHTLMQNKTVQITTCTFIAPPHSGFHSYYDQGHTTNTERKQIYPCGIRTRDMEHALIEYPDDIDTYYPQTFNVPVFKSPDVTKFLALEEYFKL